MSIISSNHRLVKVDSTEYSAGSGIDITNKIISLDPNLSAVIDDKLDTSTFSSYSATIDDELQYVSANAGKTYSGIAPIIVNNTTNEISADTQDISFGVGLDFTGGVLSVTAQGGDPEIESVVKTNSADWGTITALSSTSSLLDNKITAVRNDLNTVSTNTGYLHTDIQTTSGILSAAIDYVSSNLPDPYTGVNHDDNFSGNGKSTPLGIALHSTIAGNDIYGGPTIKLSGSDKEIINIGSTQISLWHPASGVGGGAVYSYINGDGLDFTYNAGSYYLRTLKTTNSGLMIYNRGAVASSYLDGKGLYVWDGANVESAGFKDIQKWNSVYNDVTTASGGWGGGTSLTGDAQGAVDEVYANSALWSEITGVSSNYQPIGNYANQTDLEQVSGDLKSDIDYVSANAITSLDGYATTSVVNTVSSYLSGQIDNKLDSTSFNPTDYYPMVGNPSGFISGVDLTDYQTKAGMTAYQPAGDYATTGDLYNTSSILSGAIDFISGNAGTTYTGVAPIVVTGNTISADSFDLNIGSGLAFENDTLYTSGISANEWNSNYDTVNTNSGAWGGSALQISAGPGIKFDMVNNTLVASTDETVLWSGSNVTSLNLSEPASSFNKIKVYYGNQAIQGNNVVNGCYEFIPNSNYVGIHSFFVGNTATKATYTVHTIWSGVNTTTWKRMYYAFKSLASSAWNTDGNWQSLTKIVGIGRINSI